MKIIIISQYFYPERFLLNDLVKELSSRGHEVTIVTGQPNYPKGNLFPGYSNFSRWTDSYEGCKVIRVPVIPRFKGRAYQLFLNYISFIFSCIVFGLPRVLFKKTDVIFAWGTSPILQSIPAILLKIVKRKKLYLWVQDLWPETLTAVNMIHSKTILNCVALVVKFTYRWTDYILIQSPGFKHSVLKHGGDESKIHWVPNWSMAPTEVNKTNLPRPIFDKNLFNILFAGNIGKAQSIQTIIDAASILVDNQKIMIHLLGDGSEKKWAQTFVINKKINNINFLDPCPTSEVPYYVQNCQALLVTLIDDKNISNVIPSKIQTYLASGRPIIAALNGEPYKLLLNSGAALVGPAEDPVQLSKNIKILASYTDKQCKDMSEKGKQYYNEFFDRKKVITNLTQLFKEGLN